MTPEVLEKIRKILELAKRGGTEEEADTAMKMARNILAQYNMTVDQVSFDEDDGIERDQFGHLTKKWKRNLMAAIAKLYFCKVYTDFHRQKGKGITMITGKESNIEITKNLFEYVAGVGEKLSKIYASTIDRNSFCIGFASRINTRVLEEIAKIKTQPETQEMGLVLKSMYETEEDRIKKFLIDVGVTLKKGAPTYIKNEAAYKQGQASANNVSLGRNHITDKSKSQLLIGK
jgi:hypothetical protein